MNLAITVCAAMLLAVYSTGLAGEDGRESTKSPQEKETEVVLDLRDGSRLVGVPSILSLPFQSSYAKLEIPLKSVESIEFADDEETASIHCTNGDVLHGVLSLSTITLSTSFGKVSIPLAKVARISVQAERVKRGLVLYYPFDKDEGGRVIDLSGHDRHGKVHGATWTDMGAIGGAMSFDGSASIEINDLSCVDNQDAISFGAWVYPTESGLNAVMGKTVSGSSVFFLNTGLSPSLHEFRCDVASEDQQEARYIDVPDHMKLNTWQHLFGTYDGTCTRAYYNGILVGQTKLMRRKPTNANRAIAAVGDVAFGRGWFFHGEIDEVMIFDCALSAEEVKKLYRTRGTSNGGGSDPGD